MTEIDKGTGQSSEESEDTDREIAVEKVIIYKSEQIRLTRHTIANSAFTFAMAQYEQAKTFVGLQLCWPSFVYEY